MPPLENPRHESFAQGVAEGLTADAAYAAAGYARSRQNAARLKARGDVRARIAELVAVGAERAEVAVGRVLAELAHIAFSDVRRLFDEKGRLRQVYDLEDDTARTIASIEVVERSGGAETVHKVKLWDKLSALEKIAKHLGMFRELPPPKEGGSLTDVEIAQRLAAILVAGSAAGGGDAGEAG